MSFGSPKLPPTPPPAPSAEDISAQMERERIQRRSGLGRKSVSLTAKVGKPMGVPSLTPGRNIVTGG